MNAFTCKQMGTTLSHHFLNHQNRFDKRLLFVIVHAYKSLLQLLCSKTCPRPHNHFVCGTHRIFYCKEISRRSKVGTIAHRTDAEQTTLSAFAGVPVQRNVFWQFSLLQYFCAFFPQSNWHEKLTRIALTVCVISVHCCSGSAPLGSKRHFFPFCNRRDIKIQHRAGLDIRMLHIVMNQTRQLRFQNAKAFVSAPIRTEGKIYGHRKSLLMAKDYALA